MGELLFQHRDHPSPVNSFVSFSNYKIRVKINIHYILFTKELDLCCYFVVVQSVSHVCLSATPWTAARQASCPSPSPRACSNSRPSSQWCHPTISSSVIPSSCFQSFPASGSFPVSRLFALGGQSIRVSASAPILPVSIQYWFPLWLTALISI